MAPSDTGERGQVQSSKANCPDPSPPFTLIPFVGRACQGEQACEEVGEL